MSPTVTWLMPVKNGMPYLRETLAAIAGQQFSHPHALFAWDNGSTDGSIDELHHWVPNRIPGRIIQGTPLSLGGSLARLVELAPSELCARIDADDIPEPQRLVQQVEYLDRHPEIAAAGSQVTTIDADGAVKPVTREPYYLDHDDIVHQLLYRCALRHPSVMFRKSAVLAVGNYGDMGPSEDYDLFLRLAARFKLANLPDRLLRYRYHDRSVSQTLPHPWHYHREVRSRIFARHAPALYGLSETTARRLSCRELRCAAFSLLRLLRFLDRQSGQRGVRARLASASFRASAEKLIHPRDYLTRCLLAPRPSFTRHRLVVRTWLPLFLTHAEHI